MQLGSAPLKHKYSLTHAHVGLNTSTTPPFTHTPCFSVKESSGRCTMGRAVPLSSPQRE